MISQMDSNNNDQLDYTEFIAMAINRSQVLSDNRIKSCFQMFDKNKDDTIQLKEFQEMLSGNQKIDDNVWHDMMKDITGDPDKKEVNFNEFKQIFKSLIK